MTEIAYPRYGEVVSILASQSSRVRGRVAARWSSALTVELDRPPIRRPGLAPVDTEIAVEWGEAFGAMRATARVESVRELPLPVIELELVGEPQPVQRRDHDRVPIELDVEASTGAQPDRRFAGKTVNVTAAGALLSLPGLDPSAMNLELRIAAPGGPVKTSASIRWRGEPALVGVEFERISRKQRARLVNAFRSVAPR
jgi:c-di-GMP-binding flagellar brake protein YcgR